MVKETDFRLSNLVEYNGMVMGVSGISSPKPYKDEKYAHKYIFELFDGAGLINCTLDEIKPIPLTEEWLIKFGFRKNENRLFKLFNESEVPILLNEDLNGWTCDGINFSVNGTNFVHQLQNLYFALKGEELTLK